MSLWIVRGTRLNQAISMVALNVDSERYLMAAIGCTTSTEIDPNDCLEDASVRLKECSICCDDTSSERLYGLGRVLKSQTFEVTVGMSRYI
jgi:hypothetical protein